MIVASLVASQLSGSAVQNTPQSLPADHEKDVSRFQDLMGNSSQGSGTAIEPQSLESSVLQFVEPGEKAETGDLTNRMIDMATKMDGDYHSLLAQMKDRPGFDSYLSESKDVGADDMLTYPNVSVEKSKADTFDATLERIQNSQQATLAYQSDMNDWALNFRIWSTSVEVVASAAKKVSQGFQTLFRASG